MVRVKLVDVAVAAGVHPGTASRALNPATQGQVSRATVRRVMRAAEKLGYVPNAQARALRTSRSHIVGIVVPDITNPLFPPMVRGAEQVLTSAGFTVVLTDTDNDADRERRQIESLLARGTDGFIISTARWNDPLLDELDAAGVAAVLANRNTVHGRWPYVGGDERAGVHLAVDHLVGIGHTKLLHLAGPQTVSSGHERAHAFRAAAKSHRLTTADARVTTSAAFTTAAGSKAMSVALAAGHRFTGVVAGNDLIALGAIDRLREAGLHCPDDVSVIGCNDMPFVDRLTPPLTTIRLPLEQMGQLAARALLQELDKDQVVRARRTTLLPVELIVRGSTAVPPR